MYRLTWGIHAWLNMIIVLLRNTIEFLLRDTHLEDQQFLMGAFQICGPMKTRTLGEICNFQHSLIIIQERLRSTSWRANMDAMYVLKQSAKLGRNWHVFT